MSMGEDTNVIRPYGHELVLDLASCDERTFDRQHIRAFLEELCERIGMEREDLHFWDYENASQEELHEARQNPHTFGVSAVQFIITSSVVVHTLPLLGQCYVNVFSCREFDPNAATEVALRHFDAGQMSRTLLERGAWLPE